MKKQVRCCVVVALFALAAGAVNAESGFLDFYSPQFLGGIGGTANINTPQGTVLNPAVAGGKQRVTLDLSYLALTGVNQSPVSLGGNFINAGITIPTNVGVFSTTGRFTNATFGTQGPDWGAMGGLTFAFSKDLFPDLYVGAGLGSEFGSDWGLGLDLGFLHIPGDLGFLKDFRWGIAMRNIGKGYTASNASGSLANPPVFTPAIGAHFSLLRTDPVVFSLDPDLSFPSFQDMRATIGAEILIANFLTLSGSYMYDLRQAARHRAVALAAVHIRGFLQAYHEHQAEHQRPQCDRAGMEQERGHNHACGRAAGERRMGIRGRGEHSPRGNREESSPDRSGYQW